MNTYRALAVLLGLAAAGTSPAQLTNYFREAYPLCFDLFQDEASEEHKMCIETSARNPSEWSRETLEASVRQQLEQRKKAEEAEERLRANREAASAKLDAKRTDPSALEFKGMALGLDMGTIEATGRFNCRPSGSPIADRICTLKYNEQETIAGAPVKFLLLYFYSDRLETITVSFETRHFSSVTDALNQKYGRGTVTTEALQNRMGATFENKKFIWRKGKARVEAERYYGKLDTSAITYQTDFAAEEFARRRKSAVKSNAKDL